MGVLDRFFKKQDGRVNNGANLTDELRERSIEVRQLNKEIREYEKKIKDMERINELNFLKTKYNNLLTGKEEESGSFEEKLLMQILDPMISKMFGANIINQDSTAESSTQNNGSVTTDPFNSSVEPDIPKGSVSYDIDPTEMSDEEIKEAIRTIQAKHITLAKIMPRKTVVHTVKKQYPDLPEEVVDRAVVMIKNGNY